MNVPLQIPERWPPLPDHTQLPEKDGVPVTNFQEGPQADLLTDLLEPVLRHRHPAGNYAIGRDSGIYWRPTDPPMLGCKAPDWYYVPGVPPLLNGQVRRSYVLWHEILAPLIAIEFVSGDGSEERDRTPLSGKFWVYEQGIRIPYYAIYERAPGRVAVHNLVDGSYQLLPPNERGHFPISPLGVELGIWQGSYKNMDLPWLRCWDSQGILLPTSEERVRQEIDRARQEADRAREAEDRAQQAVDRAARLAARLRELGVDPDQV